MRLIIYLFVISALQVGLGIASDDAIRVTFSNPENKSDPFLEFVATVRIAQHEITPKIEQEPASNYKITGLIRARYAALALDPAKTKLISFANGGTISPEKLRFIKPLLIALSSSSFGHQEAPLVYDLKNANPDQLEKLSALFSSLPIPSETALHAYRRIGMSPSVSYPNGRIEPSQ